AIAAAAQNHTTFIEISPHPTLTHAISDTLESTPHHSIGTLSRDGDDTVSFHTNLNSTHITQPPHTPLPPERHPVLPNTPWHHTQHWMTIENRVTATVSAPRPGTLLGEHIAVATTPHAHLWQARLMPEAQPEISTSVVLETLSAAAAECDASILSDVRFDSPIVIDQARVIQVVADGQSVTVSSSPAAETGTRRWVRHVSARITYRHDEPGRNGADHDMGRYETVPVDEGQPCGWSIGSCRSAPGRLRADVALCEVSTVALLDAALHVGGMVDDSDPRLMSPRAVERVWFARELVDDHASIEIHRCGGKADELIVDIAVTTPDGSTCIDIRSLLYAEAEPAPAAAAPLDVDTVPLAHAIQWQPWDDHTDVQPAPDALCTLAVLGHDEAARTLRDRLADAGYVAADVAEAQCVLYVVDPERVAADETDIDCAVRLSTDVADLVRRLAHVDVNPATLWIITRGVREAASDAAVRQSSLWGLAGVIRAEQPQLWGGLVDIPGEGDIGDYAEELASVLRKPAKSILALRDGQLLAPGLAPVCGQPEREPLRCCPDAAYLITGGMGALGLLMAGWLADLGARRLILAGRTPLPPRRDWDNDTNDADVCHKIAAIRALERRGVSVDAVALDVGSRSAVQALLARRDDDGAPPIRGVIHAAGLTEAQLLTETEESRLRRTMWPKIAGAQVLHEAFPPCSLDFFFLIASAGTVFGIPGQGAYASANAYLDGLARARHQKGCHTVSLDWVAWQGLGFATEAQVVLQELERLGSRPVAPGEAFIAWEHLERYDVDQAVMAPLPSSDGTAPDPHSNSVELTWSQLPAENMISELENGLRSILARELRMPEAELDLDRPFAELGLNSVMAMSVRRETEQLVGIELSVTMLWNHPTIAALAGHLAKKLLPQEDSDDDIDMLPDSAGSVLNELFDSVESASAGSESGI
ncbi:KR domain-containing protein, partial [Mycobacterium sp. NPDC048908]|uniref:KR domain-containing protein n=1 Tax=Mycobacterium sp. NPDC048908 TaxID=3364292 RepID=UPI0037111F1B